MCPFCLATAALIAGSATGAGGVTALVASALFMRKRQRKFLEQDKAQEVNRGNNSNGIKASERGLAR